MDHSFPYSTDAQGLQKNFHPVEKVNYNGGCNNWGCGSKPPPNMNTPKFPPNIFAPSEYSQLYQTVAPHFQGYSNRHREGYYMDINGRPQKTTLNFPYILQVFSPKPFEKKFQTKESALTEAPRMGDWQIVNIFTGQHVYAPFYRNNHSTQC
jgi:hypothetical protein